MDKTFIGSVHNHTHYSNVRLRDCVIKHTDLIDYAVELGHKMVAITDHDCVSGSVKELSYYKKIKKNNPDFKVILGNEIYLCRNGLNSENFNKETDKYYHFVLLAKDACGHEQIRELSTIAWKRSYIVRRMRRVPTYYQDLMNIVGNNKGHLIGSSACLGGALPTQILRGTSDDKLEKWILQMDSIFGHGNFFLEMQPSNNKEQIIVNKKLYQFSKSLDIPFIITTDTHYLKKEDRPIHKAYLKSQDGDREVDDFYATTYLMSTEELEVYFPYFEKEILQEAYQNLEKIYDMCEDYELEKPLHIPELKWSPCENTSQENKKSISNVIPKMKSFWNSTYKGDNLLADKIAHKFLRDETVRNEATAAAINECLDMIQESSEVNKAHWSAYLLNIQGIIETCWDAGSIVLPGRGSGVGFIPLYLLDITQINPLRETTPTKAWRFLNPSRVSVLDIDFDIEGGRRAQVLQKFREVYGEDRVANVITFKTEKSKAAIQTACRGLGIDVDIAKYISGLIPSDRGQTRTLSQCMYGDEENDFKPIKQFVFEMTENYPEIWEVAQKIEGLINGIGIHAGGVIFVDEPFEKSTSLMRAPDGTIITAYDLHDCEKCSLIKYDALSVEAADKIHICIDLLCDYGYAERKPTLRETYESIVGVYNLERDAEDMWKMIWNHQVLSLFQMEKESGIKGISATLPRSVEDLAHLNSVIRLMAQESGAEQPLDKYARFKENIGLWYEEMEQYGLTKSEQKLLEPYLLGSYGIAESQECFMQLVQIPECGGFDLTWADRLRKSIAKKNPAEYEQLEKEYFKTVEEKGLSNNLCNYVWRVLVATSRGYGFNLSHTLAYSIVGLQEMNLAYLFPVIFWNCACLISDSGGDEAEENEEEEIEIEEIEYDDSLDLDFGEDEDDDDEDEDDEEEETVEKKKKKKKKASNYGKIATAIGKMKMAGITVAPPNINTSSFTFSPDVTNSTIRFGLSGITKIGEDVIKAIIANRPYSSIKDFTSKVKVNKPQVINLIKAGAFDDFGDRETLMREYIISISDTKNTINLRNMKMLIDFGLIPDSYDLQRRVYNFNKYLKKFKDGNYYLLNSIALGFYEKHFSLDDVIQTDDGGFKILQSKWDKIYKKHMDIIRPYVKNNCSDLLAQVNERLISDKWNKYCLGNLSRWEMDAVSCYFSPHELEGVTGYDNFFELFETAEIDHFIYIKGKQVPILKLNRICGTVLDKDKAKKSVTLLTTDGVVTVKIFGEIFNMYDRQISEVDGNGKKHVIRKSEFARGNKIIVTGVRDGDVFRAKKYKNTPYHLIETIESVEDGQVILNNRND